jgi:hypothetical protein
MGGWAVKIQLLTHDDATQDHIAYTSPAEFQDSSSVLGRLGAAVTEQCFVLFYTALREYWQGDCVWCVGNEGGTSQNPTFIFV